MRKWFLKDIVKLSLSYFLKGDFGRLGRVNYLRLQGSNNRNILEFI